MTQSCRDEEHRDMEKKGKKKGKVWKEAKCHKGRNGGKSSTALEHTKFCLVIMFYIQWNSAGTVLTTLAVATSGFPCKHHRVPVITAQAAPQKAGEIVHAT